ncbi:putative uncharacterized protein [Waddlia chondrophila 2032/99]|uniref:Uncharacterized protein n=1 Tax=Waddlia chondrophila 2032/99 TaxID=765953 RepID=F8LE50_9BACT|nr:putative uncharacterized protein [Waddlia chondrophila 2032/99]
MQVTPRNFFTDFMLDPFSEKISATDRKICFIASLCLGLLTAGLIHLGMIIYNWASRCIKDPTHVQNENKEPNHSPPLHRRISSADQRDIKIIQRELEATLRTLEDQVKDRNRLDDFKELCQQIFDNSSQLITECMEEPELRQFIIESTKNELSALISTAAGIEKFPEAQDSFDEAKWRHGISLLIRKGRHHYRPEMNDELSAIVKIGPNINTRADLWFKGTILHDLAKFGEPSEFVAIFADNGIDFNIQDRWDNTALIWAIANGNNSMASEILNYPQNLDLKGLGNSALHLAIAKGYKNRTRDGKPLTISNLQLVQKLVDKGADPNLRNKNGYTALHLACIRRDAPMIEALLKNGGDLSIQTNDGKTCKELLEYTFKEAGAIINEVTSVYLLPKDDFDSGYEECKKLI